MSASFVSGEIGNVDATTLVITFSEAVTNSFINGITVRVNNAIVFYTAQQQTNHAIVYFTIPTCDSDDIITWQYSTVLPNVWDTQFAWTQEDYRK